MNQQYLIKSKFFLVLMAITVMTLSAIPFIKKALAEASDVYVQERMHFVQAEMFFYDLKKGNVHKICLDGNIVLLQHDVNLESGGWMSCSVDRMAPSISFYTPLKREDGIYCVDTFGFQGLLEGKHPVLPGRCSK